MLGVVGLDAKIAHSPFLMPWLETWDDGEFSIQVPVNGTSVCLLDEIEKHGSSQITFVDKLPKWIFRVTLAQLLHDSEKPFFRLHGLDLTTLTPTIRRFYFDFNHYVQEDGEKRDTNPIINDYSMVGLVAENTLRELATQNTLLYLENVWNVYRNTGKIEEALKANLGFPQVDARWNKSCRKPLVEFKGHHPRAVQRRLEYYKKW